MNRLRQMAAGLIVVAAAALPGCGRQDEGRIVEAVVDRQVAETTLQQEEYQRQLDRTDRQLERAEQQLQRQEELLSRQEKQAERYDKLLDRWEAQAR